MRVLVACEFSGVVRDAFRARGHNAWSCDLLATEREGPHIFGDVLEVVTWGWDLMIAHPPCTALCRAGDRWYRQSAERAAAVEFVQQLYAAPVPRIAIENPRGLNRFWRQADQVVQPWMFGHGETKATCLWLKGLPPLMATAVRTEREPRVFYAAPGPNRWKERSRTLEGVAAAMADQWGNELVKPYVYIQSESQLWTVGFYRPDGEWIPESDHQSVAQAAGRVHYLNGGADERLRGALAEIMQGSRSLDYAIHTARVALANA